MKSDQQKGFSTVQWMTLIAGMAVLAAVTYAVVLPAYEDYKVQSKVSEVFVSVDACRAVVAQVVQSTSAPVLSTELFSCDGGASSGAKISRHLVSIAVRGTGAITVTLDYRSLPELTRTTSTLTLVPLVDANTALGSGDVRRPIFAWRCGSPQDGTTIPGKYLPSSCRG
jgi:type IV pilus assembly protein PilA